MSEAYKHLIEQTIYEDVGTEPCLSDAAVATIVKTVALHTLKVVADLAWGIALMQNAGPKVCLPIEALSDDPAISAKIVSAILNGGGIDI